MKLFKTAITALLALAVSLPALASETPNLDKINERGSLRVGMSTFVPWAMRNKQGDLVGFEIDVAKRHSPGCHDTANLPLPSGASAGTPEGSHRAR